MEHYQRAETNTILCILDMRDNVHYTLERLPSITRALIGKNVVYKNIYDFEDEFGSHNGPDRVNQPFVSYVNTNNIRFIFTSSEIFDYISVDTISYLIARGIVLSSVLGDDENNYHININYLGLLTIPVAYQKDEHRRYLTVNPNTYRLPISVSLYGTEDYLDCNKTQDVIFIGKAYGKRPELITYLTNNGINIAVYGGSDWAKHLSDDVYKGYIENSDYYDKISQSKITLAFLESPKNNELLHVNAKPFDAAKTGTALITTRYKKFFDDYRLEEGEDLFAYSTTEELLIAIKALLANGTKRELIAQNFRQKISVHYDYDDLYREFFETLLGQNFAMPEVSMARVLYVNINDQPLKDELDQYDYIIFKKDGVVYSDSIKNVLAAHVSSNYFVKLDSHYKGKVARKIFDYVDIASLAIPVNRLSEVKILFGLVKLNKDSSAQTFISLNRYTSFNVYISALLVLRAVYKRFTS